MKSWTRPFSGKNIHDSKLSLATFASSLSPKVCRDLRRVRWSTENEDTSGVFANAWVDRFWHSERVSVQLGDRETRVASTHSLSLRFYLSRSLPFLPTLSYLSFSLTQRDYCREHPGGQSVRRQPPRRRDAPLSLSFLSALSAASAASRRYDALRRLSYPGRDAVVNFPTIYTSDTNLAIDNDRDIRKQVFFSHIATSKVFSICQNEEKVLIVICKS